MGGRWLYVRAVECTFYLQGDLLQPWGEELDPVPVVGARLDRHGDHYVVDRVVFHDWAGIRAQEASIWLRWAEPDTGVH